MFRTPQTPTQDDPHPKTTTQAATQAAPHPKATTQAATQAAPLPDSVHDALLMMLGAEPTQQRTRSDPGFWSSHQSDPRVCTPPHQSDQRVCTLPHQSDQRFCPPPHQSDPRSWHTPQSTQPVWQQTQHHSYMNQRTQPDSHIPLESRLDQREYHKKPWNEIDERTSVAYNAAMHLYNGDMYEPEDIGKRLGLVLSNIPSNLPDDEILAFVQNAVPGESFEGRMYRNGMKVMMFITIGELVATKMVKSIHLKRFAGRTLFLRRNTNSLPSKPRHYQSSRGNRPKADHRTPPYGQFDPLRVYRRYSKKSSDECAPGDNMCDSVDTSGPSAHDQEQWVGLPTLEPVNWRTMAPL